MKRNGMEPIVGMYTIYELARTFVDNCPVRASELFTLLRELRPIYCCQRHELYNREAQKLKYDAPVNYFLAEDDLLDVNARVLDFSEGIFEKKLETFIEVRQEGLTQSRKHWDYPKNKISSDNLTKIKKCLFLRI